MGADGQLLAQPAAPAQVFERAEERQVTDKTLRGIERATRCSCARRRADGPERRRPMDLPAPDEEDEKVYVNIDILCQLLKEDVAAGEIGSEDFSAPLNRG